MNEPTQADLDAAQTLIPCNCGTKTHKHMTDCPRHGIAWEDVADALHAAREAGRQSALPPANHILDDKGVVKRVDGKLPETRDGVVWTDRSKPVYTYGGKPYYLDQDWNVPIAVFNDDTREWRDMHISGCYSTEAAAEAARAAGGGE